jgi:acyl transferase domain-containing protein/acyl carrier protein
MTEDNLDGYIAIIGMDCQIPGASNVYEFWDNLKNEVESITEFSKDELLESQVPLSKINNPKYVPRRGIVNGVEKFDAGFFGFTPREAELLDPQHRLFLECCWHSLEDAGYAERSAETRVGVFGGAGTAWYLNDVINNPKVKKYADATSVVIGADRDYLTTRVSYKLNLNGPSLNIQSACSTSTAAIILGIQSLQTYQSDLILAGGVSVQYPEKVGYVHAPGGMESSDGRCHPFDKNANGTVFSRGCGVVLLKRLEDAIEDKDHIYSVIRAGAMNNDGNKKVGYTAPSVEGQKEVLLETIELADISPESITMVEAHGTATPVGDPIEISSLSEAFRNYTKKNQYCAVGSVKSNIGHTDTAAGVISIIKTSMALHQKQIPASINYTEANPAIDFENSPFFVNTKLKDWQPLNNEKRYALVNSFGVGGTNACLILEEPPKIVREEITQSHTDHILAFSGKNPQVIEDYANSFKKFVTDNKDINLHDLSYSSMFKRKHFKHRAYLTYKNQDDLIQKLNNSDSLKKGTYDIAERNLVFMFPGQGNQYINMGKQLYNKYKVFADVVDNCAGLLKDELNLDIRTVIYPDEDDETANSLIDKTYITQPAIFIISYAQALLLQSWGLKANYFIGHSVGEYVAATLSGIFELKDALIAVARRAKLIQSLPGGAMSAVLLSEEDITPMLPSNTSIGAINTPGLSVVSGPYEEIEEFEKGLSEKRIFNKRIPTSHAFHSSMMNPILDEMTDLFKKIKLNKPGTPIISTLTGEQLTDEEATSAEYWVKHVRNTVRFSEATITCMKISPSIFMEVGPGQSLESAVKRHLTEQPDHSVLGSIKPDTLNINDCEYLTNSVGRLWTYGVNVDPNSYFYGEELRTISFPLYPFQKKKYIVELPKGGIFQRDDEADVKDPDIGNWVYLPSWKKTQNIDLLLKQYLAGMSTENEDRKVWLILKDSFGLGDIIRSKLLEIGKEVICVIPGVSFNKYDDYNFTIDIANKNDYEDLIKDLIENGRTPNRVIHLYNVEETLSETNLENCIRFEDSSYYSALYLEQAFINNSAMNDLNILFVANGVLDVIGEDVVCPQKSLAMGPARCVSREFKKISAKFVDIDSKAPDLLSVANMLIKETNFRCDDSVIAYRKGYRWTERFDKTYYDEVTNPQPIFKDNGTYIILGGTGGLGLEFAKHISTTTKANIILTYRTALPEKGTWESYTNENPNDIISEKINTIQEIENNGCNVYLIHAEADNFDQMKAVKDFAIGTFGHVDGIIHSAGAAGGGIISLKSKEMSEDVLKAKTRGTLIIDQLFDINELDFVSYFSSISSVTGEASRVDYTSANSFLDNYANYRNQIKPNSTISINWTSWSKVGMAARWEETQLVTRKKLYINEKSTIPGLHLLSSNDQQETYQIGLNETNDWVYKEHLLTGKYTFVGTFFIEMFIKFARNKFESKSPQLTEFYFLKPFVVEKNEQPILRIFAIPDKGKIKLNLSTANISKETDIWDVIATAYVTGVEPQEKQIIDINQEIKNLKGEKILTDMFSEVVVDGKEILRYSDRWLNINNKYKGKNRYIIEQEIADKYVDDLNNFIIHPAILDTSVANIFVDFTTKVFLPYNYKSITVHGNFTKKMYVIIDIVSEINDDSKLATFDLNFYNQDRELVLQIDKYSLMNLSDKVDSDKNESSSDLAAKKQSFDEDNILPEEGVEIFDRIYYYNNGTNVIVTPYNLHKELYDTIHDDIVDNDDNDSVTTYERPDISSDYVEPTNEIEETVAGIWGQILGIGQIGINDSFNELGGNSLLVVQAISNISHTFEIELTADIFGTYPTVKTLSEYIMSLLVEDIDESELVSLLEDTQEND